MVEFSIKYLSSGFWSLELIAMLARAPLRPSASGGLFPCRAGAGIKRVEKSRLGRRLTEIEHRRREQHYSRTYLSQIGTDCNQRQTLRGASGC
jgi:hypothetical protein